MHPLIFCYNTIICRLVDDLTSTGFINFLPFILFVELMKIKFFKDTSKTLRLETVSLIGKSVSTLFIFTVEWLTIDLPCFEMCKVSLVLLSSADRTDRFVAFLPPKITLRMAGKNVSCFKHLRLLIHLTKEIRKVLFHH